nr:hypothetical protein [Tanacetum cinerariifolium]
MSCSGGCSKHAGMDQREYLLDRDKSTDKESDNTDEMSHVLGSLGAADILASGGLRSAFTTSNLSVATASTGIYPAVATASGSFPTATIFTTASVATPTTRVTRSSRGVVIGSSSLISVLEQLSIRLARDLEAKFAQEDLIIREQAMRDFDIAMIHAEKELEMMIAELDMSNEIAKYLSEYEQVAIRLSHDEKVELINALLMYQRHLAQIKKYQAQQNKPATKTEKRYFYMSILRSNAGWKAKDFKGMTFEHIEEKFIPLWEKMQDFVPMNSKLESERLKRPRIQLDKERSKKLKTTEASGTEPTQEQQSEEPKELSEKELKKMMELVSVKELYIEALQVKYPIIDWEVYSEGQRKCWKITRVGNHTEVYQMFEGMLKKFDREDLDKLWILVKKTCSTTEVTDEKAKELWVELKRLYEPDSRDPLWALERYMHDLLIWRLYDTCGVHHVSTGRGHQIFMLVEKDYPLTKGLTTLMVSNKLQVDQYLKMANELLESLLGLILYRTLWPIKGILRIAVVMKLLVNISKRHAFWSLNEYILKIINSDYQYAVSIKEDTAYPCLHSPKTTKETSSIRLDSWTSRLLVYKEPLSSKWDGVLPKSKNDMPLRDK